MQCPRCEGELKIEKYKDIEVDQCDQCNGMWLDYVELDELEDTVYDDDEAKASLILRDYDSKLSCPRCEKTMRAFGYRGWSLELDYCPDKHGYWLDAGEEKRVLELMKRRKKDVARTQGAEAAFGSFLKNLKSKKFFRNLR
jgi:Zn-finger nucleic acid-binding protein